MVVQVVIDTKGGSIEQTAMLTALPVVTMILGSAAVKLATPSERIQARLQLLSGGLLIGAVVTDIFPMLKSRIINEEGGEHKVSLPACLSALAGFVCALVLMYGIKSLEFDDEDDDGEGDAGEKKTPGASPNALATPLLLTSPVKRQPSEKWDVTGTPEEGEAGRLRIAINRLATHTSGLVDLVKVDHVDREAVDEAVHGLDFLIDSTRRLCRGANPIDQHNAGRLRHHIAEMNESVKSLQQVDPSQIPQIDKLLKDIAATLRHVHSHAERGTFRRWAIRRHHAVEVKGDNEEATSANKVAGKLPVSLMLAVILDACVDGMLIGLASAVAQKSGQLMAIATAIEMGFLGYSFACSITGQARPVIVAAVLAMPPLAMFFASVLASSGTDFLMNSPAFVGLIAFAMVALLFLVLQELLLEAHEKEGGDEWHITVWLYIGLLMSMVFEVML